MNDGGGLKVRSHRSQASVGNSTDLIRKLVLGTPSWHLYAGLGSRALGELKHCCLQKPFPLLLSLEVGTAGHVPTCSINEGFARGPPKPSEPWRWDSHPWRIRASTWVHETAASNKRAAAVQASCLLIEADQYQAQTISSIRPA